MIGMEKSWAYQLSNLEPKRLDVLSGFFLRTMKTVSNSSTYLVR